MFDRYARLGEYELRHLPAHLAEAGRLAELLALLADEEFAGARRLTVTDDEISRDFGLTLCAIRNTAAAAAPRSEQGSGYSCWTDWDLRNLPFHMVRSGQFPPGALVELVEDYYRSELGELPGRNWSVGPGRSLPVETEA